MIDGWMSEEELGYLAERAKEVGSICEVGCYKGRSTYELLSNCKGKVTVVDNFSMCTKEEFLGNCGHFANIELIEGNSQDVAEKVGDFDMVFIDADHSYEGVKKDIKSWGPKCHLLCGHDYDLNDVKRAVDEAGGKQVAGSIWSLS